MANPERTPFRRLIHPTPSPPKKMEHNYRIDLAQVACGRPRDPRCTRAIDRCFCIPSGAETSTKGKKYDVITISHGSPVCGKEPDYIKMDLIWKWELWLFSVFMQNPKLWHIKWSVQLAVWWMELSAGTPISRGREGFSPWSQGSKTVGWKSLSYTKRRRYNRIAEIKINCASFAKLHRLR